MLRPSKHKKRAVDDSTTKAVDWDEKLGFKRKSTTVDPKYAALVPVLDCDADAASAARTQHWTLVIGIPTVDHDRGKVRRNLQRETWFKYDAIARFGDDDHAQQQQRPRVLTRFLLGLHPDNNFEISDSAKTEARDRGDVIVLNMREGKPATAKTPGGAGYWGLESEVGMSRKAYLWYVLATRYDCDFVAKADDDLFLRVNIVAEMMKSIAASMAIVKVGANTVTRFPHLECGRRELADNLNDDDGGKKKAITAGGSSAAAASADESPPLELTESFSTPYVYWGRTMKWGAKKGDPTSKFPFVGGMFIAMSRALAHWIKNSRRAAVNNLEPFVPGDKLRYKRTNHDHEDVMVGRWIYDELLPVCVISDCRFHDVHVGANVAPVKPNSLGLHHLRVEEYQSFMSKYADDVEKQGRQIAGFSAHLMDRIRNTTGVKRQASRVISVC